MRHSKWRRIVLVCAITTVLAVMTAGSVASASTATKADLGTRAAAGVRPLASATSPYLAIQVGADGRFNSGATGSVTGKVFNITFRWPNSPWSSFTTVRVDGVDAKYGSADGVFSQAPTDINAVTNQSVWALPKVQVTQRLEIVTGSSTGRADTGMYRYTLKNTDTVPHTVGLRIMLDTCLADNDRAPFRVPGTGSVTTEMNYVGGAVPEYWQAFKDLADTAIMAQGTLRGGAATLPNRFAITNWGNINSTLWDYTTTPAMETGDSAVGMWWNPVTLQPGQSRVITTYYGLGTVSGTTNPTLTGPVSLSVVNGVWSPNPFTVTAYLANGTTAPLVNTPITLALPAGLQFAPGETATHVIANVPIGQTGVSSWSVRAVNVGTWIYSATARGVTASRSVFVSGGPGAIATALRVTSRSSSALRYGSTFTVKGTLKRGANGLVGQNVILQSRAPGKAFKDSTYGVATHTGGAFTFSVKPTTKTYYRVRFAGSIGYLPSGPTASVYARPKTYVSKPVAPSTMRRTRYYRVYGFLKPKHTAGSTPVRIYKYRRVGSQWKRIGTPIKAKAFNYRTYTKYSVRLKLGTKGKWRLKAYAPADSGHAATWARGYDSVTVK